MRSGGGKAKGSTFEREVCKHLSLWITQGKEEDVFWRSAMSGGRATNMRARRHWVHGGHAAGDICAVGDVGHEFTDTWFIETKFYKDLNILSFVLGLEQGELHSFWTVAAREAKKHNKVPMLIAKQNRLKPFVVARLHDLANNNGDDDSWPCASVLTMDWGTEEIGLFWMEDLFPVPIVKPKRRTA